MKVSGGTDGLGLDLVGAYQAHRHSLFSYFRRCGAPREAAEDLVQSVFVVLLQRAAEFDPRRAPVRVYMFGIARNLRREWERSARRMPGSAVRCDQATAPFELGLDVAAAVGSLPEEQRELLILRELHGFSYEELARICDVPTGTVRSRLSRAREALREILGAR